MEHNKPAPGKGAGPLPAGIPGKESLIFVWSRSICNVVVLYQQNLFKVYSIFFHAVPNGYPVDIKKFSRL